jgi:Domain of unknown function (DUF4389)
MAAQQPVRALESRSAVCFFHRCPRVDSGNRPTSALGYFHAIVIRRSTACVILPDARWSSRIESLETLMDIKAPEDKPTTQDIWMRGLFMLLFMIGFWAGHTLLNLLTLVQFLWLLFAHEPNRFLARFGSSLSIWFSEVARFLSCTSEDKPFPWKPWPDADATLP